MESKRIAALVLALGLAAGALAAQEGAAPAEPTGQEMPQRSSEDTPTFAGAADSVQARLEESLAELDALRERIADEKIPLSRRLSELEKELGAVRREFQDRSRELDGRTLELGNLRSEIESREDQNDYLAGLLGEYIRNFEAGLHIAEQQRYEEPLETAKLAAENTSLSEEEVFRAQADLLAVSLGRLEAALGGDRFEGTAVDPTGVVREGTFVLVGPSALFRSGDGAQVGSAEQRLGSLEPTVVPFPAPEDAAAASRLVETGEGALPLDPTLGDAHKVAATKESFVEHVRKGGLVMIPIFALAAAALLVALYKWAVLAFQAKASRRAVEGLLEAVEQGDAPLAQRRAGEMKGPVGRMLAAGVEHVREPRELIEEVMYETVLKTRLRLQRFLSFIAVSAASAPLLGLLGTVTGIINTFKMITVFGSGDVKALSGGISEALITTKFGLIVAIPSLLLHAFLSRKARGVVGEMEQAAVAFVNQVSKSGWGRAHFRRDEALPAVPDPDLIRSEVRAALDAILAPMVRRHLESELARSSAEPR